MDVENDEISNTNDSQSILVPTETAEETQEQEPSIAEPLEYDSSNFTENLNQDIVVLRQEALELHQEILDLRQNIVDLRSMYGGDNSNTNSDNDSDVIIIEPDLAVYDLCENSNLSEISCSEDVKFKDDSQQEALFLSDREPFVQCKICLNSAVKNVPITTICGHIFCKPCILSALKIKLNCPVCRRIITFTDLIKLCL